jgi:hypothetical protein
MNPDQHLTVSDIMSGVMAAVSDKFITVIAAGAILLHMWRPALQSISELSSELAPFLGCLLLIARFVREVQLIRHRKSRVDGDEP